MVGAVVLPGIARMGVPYFIKRGSAMFRVLRARERRRSLL
jgi:hypothetical protein